MLHDWLIMTNVLKRKQHFNVFFLAEMDLIRVTVKYRTWLNTYISPLIAAPHCFLINEWSTITITSPTVY